MDKHPIQGGGGDGEGVDMNTPGRRNHKINSDYIGHFA